MNRDKSNGSGSEEPPLWLTRLLRDSSRSADFQHRCEKAAKLAKSISELRRANEERAFQRISLQYRLSNLAKVSGIQLKPVLAWFGVKTLTLKDPDDALVKVCSSLGFTAERFLEYLQIGEAKAQGYAIPVSARHIQESLNKLPWDRVTKARFRSLKEALHAEYELAEDRRFE